MYWSGILFFCILRKRICWWLLLMWCSFLGLLACWSLLSSRPPPLEHWLKEEVRLVLLQVLMLLVAADLEQTASPCATPRARFSCAWNLFDYLMFVFDSSTECLDVWLMLQDEAIEVEYLPFDFCTWPSLTMLDPFRHELFILLWNFLIWVHSSCEYLAYIYLITFCSEVLLPPFLLKNFKLF